ncbi:purine permease 3 [Canna indica]|uniref:Probable purine permease n=1 Tax=Canna indica TaxID=4628 RepID=A0AAQ3KH88_9LILI|nr:purine permease 3 [Canna indica]
MEVESQQPPPNEETSTKKMNKCQKRTIQLLSFASVIVGATCAPLTLRIYFLHGGQRKWLSSWVQTAAWPLTLLPLAVSYLYRRRRRRADQPLPKLILSTPPVLLAATILGLFLGLDDFFYAYGAAYLPVSTSSIILSTQLAFTALFAFLIVKQKFTAFSVNALVLLIIGAVLLGLGANGDRPEGETRTEYYLGFFMMVAAAALYGLVLTLLEFTYAKAKQVICYTVAMEVQLVFGFVATALCTVGMFVNNDFHAMKREAQEFGLGELKYYMILIWSAILCEFLLLGAVGTIFYGSALLAGIMFAVCIPTSEILAVIFLHESFTGDKGVALAISLWGFASYFYGEHRIRSIKKPVVEFEPERSIN